MKSPDPSDDAGNIPGACLGVGNSATTTQEDEQLYRYARGKANDGTTIPGTIRRLAFTASIGKSEEENAEVVSPAPLAIIGISGKMYDATKFAHHHPGGDIIYEFHNKDATAQFLAYHDMSILDRYKLKVMSTYQFDPRKPGGSSFQAAWMKLNEKFVKEGRYQTPISFLLSRIILLIGFAIGMFTMIHLYNASGNEIYFGLGTVCLAAVWQQSGFLLHDTMHNHVTHNRNIDQGLGFVFGNIILGVSGKWWRDEHNEHHVFVNTFVKGVGSSDPQMTQDAWIQSEHLLPFFAKNIVDYVLEYQQYYFVPVLMIVGLIRLRIASATGAGPGRYLDYLGVVLHFCLVAGALSLLPSTPTRLIFYFVANSISGCLGIQLLVSHYMKPWAEKEDTKQPGSWAARQIEALADISCPVWLDWFHGGLHLHSIHHLYPRMCRYHYRDVYDEIITMCEEHEVRLDRFSWFEAIGLTVQHLSNVKKHASMMSLDTQRKTSQTKTQ